MSGCALAALLAGALLGAAFGAPARARWVDPCGITGTNTFSGLVTSSHFVEVFGNIRDRSLVAHKKALNIKDIYVNKVFNDPEWETGVSDMRQGWLPEIPEMSLEHFKSVSMEEAFQKSYEHLQYFAVGLEQIVLDQVLYQGEQETQFIELEGELTQILCELQLGMKMVGLAPNPDVTRAAMQHKYRDVREKSRRNLRNYIILRDFLKLTDYIAKLFTYHISNLNT